MPAGTATSYGRRESSIRRIPRDRQQPGKGSVAHTLRLWVRVRYPKAPLRRDPEAAHEMVRSRGHGAIRRPRTDLPHVVGLQPRGPRNGIQPRSHAPTPGSRSMGCGRGETARTTLLWRPTTPSASRRGWVLATLCRRVALNDTTTTLTRGIALSQQTQAALVAASLLEFLSPEHRGTPCPDRLAGGPSRDAEPWPQRRCAPVGRRSPSRREHLARGNPHPPPTTALPQLPPARHQLSSRAPPVALPAPPARRPSEPVASQPPYGAAMSLALRSHRREAGLRGRLRARSVARDHS